MKGRKKTKESLKEQGMREGVGDEGRSSRCFFLLFTSFSLTYIFKN
jgi:hypothetical protein